MSGRRALLVGLLVTTATAALAHPAPPSYVRLDFEPAMVRAELMLPVTELAFAMTTAPTPEDLAPYLLRHVGAHSSSGEAWSVKVMEVHATTYLEQPYLEATIELTPPAQVSAREFVFTNDAVTHEVRNHVVMVVAERDFANAGAAPTLLGALQYPARELAIRR
jgi:hypothetical protein